MLDSIFGSQVYKVMENGLDASVIKHEVIANNIANVDTPRFKRSEVVFENLLQRSMDGSGTAFGGDFPVSSDPALVKARIYKSSDTSMRLDGNNVDVDAEMSKLAENSLYYEGLMRLMGNKYSGLKNAIREGR